jgi:hypothetical protein
MVLDQSGPHLADTVLHYKGVVLDSIIEDRLLAETSKVEANRQLVEELRLKKRGLAQLLLQATTASPGAKSRFELRYGAVVFSADSPPRWVTLGSARDIEASLRRYQRLVRKATRSRFRNRELLGSR